MTGAEVVFRLAISDHAPGIRAGLLLAEPLIYHILCWPHVMRRVSGGQWGLGKDGIATVRSYLRLIHLSRSVAEFGGLGALACSELRALGAVEETIQNFEKQYLQPPFDTWFISASGIPGVVPNQNAQESHNRVFGAGKILQLRAALDYLLNKGFPDVLRHDARFLTMPTSRSTGAPQAQHVAQASEILQLGGYRVVEKPMLGVSRTGIYINSYTYGKGQPIASVAEAAALAELTGKSKHQTKTAKLEAEMHAGTISAGEEVTLSRMKSYNSALDGLASKQRGVTMNDYGKLFFNLHLVTRVRGELQCDCAAFWSLKVGFAIKRSV